MLSKLQLHRTADNNQSSDSPSLAGQVHAVLYKLSILILHVGDDYLHMPDSACCLTINA